MTSYIFSVLTQIFDDVINCATVGHVIYRFTSCRTLKTTTCCFPTHIMSQDEDEEDFLFDDSCLWEQSDSLRQGEMLSCWIFSKEKSGTTTLLLDGKEYMIHDNAIGIMSFFEVYCNANRCCPQTVFSKQLGGYLHHLRELVCTEVRSTNRQRLQAPMWQPWSLRRWAVRVKHGFNHSPKACAMYMEYCAKKDWKPYQHDNPLLYGGF